MSDIREYVDNIVQNGKFPIDNIIVEHRSNNPKRDFLFVNKAQCMHIPNKATEITAMCKELADMVNKKAVGKNILAIGFAETATAIGNLVADNLNGCSFVMTTTREEIYYGTAVIDFKEEHSHAPSQKLMAYDNFNIGEYDYILFVEDEISTGKTILNFVKEIEEYAKGNGCNEALKFGVASVCNWMTEENHAKFAAKNIDVFCLISGTLKNADKKMNIADLRTAPFNDNVFEKKYISSVTTASFVEERLGHKPNRNVIPLFNKCKAEIAEYIIKNELSLVDYNNIRVIGTEECKYPAVKLAEHLQEKIQFLNVFCQSTTRSPIDVAHLSGEYITSKYCVQSLYEKDRNTYIYNVDAKYYLNIIVTDAVITKKVKKSFKRILGKNCIFISTSSL